MKIATAVSLVLAASVMSAPVFAQGAGARMTPEEREARFVAADTDKDGKLTKAEWMAQLPEQAKSRADQLWARLDADGDGSVTKEQFVALRMGPGGGQQGQ